MPRINQKAEEYARADFLQEIRRCQGAADLMNGKLLSNASGVPYGILMRRLKEPESFTLGEIRSMIKSLHLNPVVLLKFLGYSGKDISKLKGDSANVPDP